MPDLQFHVRDVEDPNTDLNPNDYFTVVPVGDNDYIVPHSPENLHSFQWGTIDGDSDLHLFVYIEKKTLSQMIPYNAGDQHW